MKTVSKVLLVAALIGAAIIAAAGQGVPTQIQTQQLTLLPQNPVAQVTQVTAAPSIQGSTSYFYWFVDYVGGVASAPAGPFLVNNAPAALGGINSVSLKWTPVPGATAYDVLRTSSSAAPSGACACAVATTVTLTTLVDSSASTSAYSVSTPLSQVPLVLTNLSSLAGIKSTVVVDGVTVTTVAQALATLNGNGGTIDARGCTPGSLDLGTFDAASVILLLGPCTYNFTAFVEEPGLQIIGSGSYGVQTFLNYVGPSNSFFFTANSRSQDLSSMVLTGFAIGNFGSATNVGCMNVNPSQTNTSAEENYIYNTIWQDTEASPPPCLVLHGTNTSGGSTGENTVNEFTISGNTFLLYPIDLDIIGAASSVVFQGNLTDTNGNAVTCDATGGNVMAVLIAGNTFANTNTPVSNTGCHMTTLANMGGTGNNTRFPDTIDGNPTVSQTGSVTVGHVATFSAPGVIQDGGTLPTASPAIQSEFFSTLSADIPLTANTVTTILTQAVTMPVSGCPCRADIRYGMLSTIDNQTLDATVSDGTNNFATSQTETTSTAPTGQTGAQVTNVTYANSANVTFTLKAETSGVGTTVKAAAQQLGQNTFLSITIMTSN